MQPLPHHMASSGHVQLPTGWPRSHMLPPGMPMLGMQYGLPPGHMHPRMPAATPMHMMPPHMMIHPMQPAAGGVVMASAPPPHDAGALARFFDLSTISNAVRSSLCMPPSDTLTCSVLCYTVAKITFTPHEICLSSLLVPVALLHLFHQRSPAPLSHKTRHPGSRAV